MWTWADMGAKEASPKWQVVKLKGGQVNFSRAVSKTLQVVLICFTHPLIFAGRLGFVP